jgi:hypothetical protein
MRHEVRLHRKASPRLAAGVECTALEASRSGFRAWRTLAPSARALADATLTPVIDRSFKASDRTHGARPASGATCWRKASPAACARSSASCARTRLTRPAAAARPAQGPRRTRGDGHGERARPRIRRVGTEPEMGPGLHHRGSARPKAGSASRSSSTRSHGAWSALRALHRSKQQTGLFRPAKAEPFRKGR